MIDQGEWLADRHKAALLAGGVKVRKTEIWRDNRKINPEFAGYGVLILFPIARRNPVTLVVPFSKAFSSNALGGASNQFGAVNEPDLQLNE